MRTNVAWLIACLMLLFPIGVMAAADISDIVVDETITFYGRHFYEAFNTALTNAKLTDYGQLTVVERPDSNAGSLISIIFEQEPIVSLTISAADRNIDANAELAAIGVVERIRTKLFFDRFFPNPDLVGSDF